jgi:hypothetical protein
LRRAQRFVATGEAKEQLDRAQDSAAEKAKEVADLERKT